MKKYIPLMSFLLAGLVMTSVQTKVEATEKLNQFQFEQTNTMQAEAEGKQYLNIGSVSKVYAATAVMQLVDQGKVDIDDPVTKYIPEFKLADERYKDITVRMLMNHTSGLMGSVYAGAFRFDDKSMDYHDHFLEILSEERLKYAPGEYNCYCNDGFTLLEILVERVSGMSFTEYMEEYITSPLGLNNTKTMWNVSSFDNQVPCYKGANIKMAPECTQLMASGGIMSDSSELCAFGATFFEGNEVLLSENAKNMMAENQAAGLSKECFGLGWDEVYIPDFEAAGVKILQKGGDTGFQHASLTVAPEEEISIAVISSGGGSGVNEDLARKLMDIALEEKGVEVKHQEKEVSQVVDQIPEELKIYEGLYTRNGSILSVSFPEDKYLSVKSLEESNLFEYQFLYTENGYFIEVSGDVESGNAIPVKPINVLSFETAAGRDFIKDESSYICERIIENSVGDSVQSAWDDRDGVTYYCISLNYNDTYILQPTITLNTYAELGGYVNGSVMIDENHAENRVNIPGSTSRDISDMVITEKNGCEILTASNISYISEKNIPDYSSDMKEVKTESGNAKWYRLNGVENETVRLDIPENASVYVFDKFGKLKYSNYMVDHGSYVPLPEYGMIVFMGDTGAKIGISR